MNLGKRQSKKLIWILLLTVFLAYLRGWMCVLRDSDDANIGTKFTFNTKMVFFKEVSQIDNSISWYVERYDGRILPKWEWDEITGSFPEISAVEVSCNEVFSVTGAFTRIPVGVLRGATSSGPIKYYVINSEKFPNTIVGQVDYDTSTRAFDLHSNDTGRLHER
jgi:hypothetical protein